MRMGEGNMTEFDLIMKENSGSRFIRGDLHIHSYGTDGSYDVTDSNMTPENIVDIAAKQGLEVISITDHDAIGNVNRSINYAGTRVLVIPGVEISTSQGHLLVYFAQYDSLRKFYGKLDFKVDEKSGVGRQVCRHTISQCLALAKEYGGIGIASHIDSESGFEVEIKGYGAFKEEIILAENLLALEIKNKDNTNLYSSADDNNDRVQMYDRRRISISEDSCYELAKVMFSDAHNLESFEKNASKDKKTTKFKMDTLDFESLRIALLDSTARVRIEELLPKSFPHFIGMRIEGGLMDGQVVKFSNNLTCIIGGRGTGKSTMLESLRAASGNFTDSFLEKDESGESGYTLKTGKVSDTVVGAYKKIENDVVSGYKKIEDKFIDAFLEEVDPNEKQHENK